MGFFKREKAAPPPPMRVVDLTRGSELGDRIELAGTGESRRKGLLGRTGLADGEGLWIVPCESVHSFGMKFPIDVVYVDRRLKVKKVRHSMVAWRISGCLTAHSVIELPAGKARAAGIERGDQLEATPDPFRRAK